MNTKTKKGFTLTELIIVVVIIGILAAVLIPTLTACVKKAKISNDKQLVRNLNLALSTDSLANRDGEKHKNMQEALDAAEIAGYLVDRINATKADNEILWDSKNDVFCYLNGEDIEYIPSSVSEENALTMGDAKKEAQLWQIVKLTGNEQLTSDAYPFSVYAAPGSTVTSITTNKGFDAGKEAYTSISYVNNSGIAKDVGIRTNSAATSLTIDAASDTVKHYGEVGSLNIIAVANASYHEYGKASFAEIKTGRIVLESKSEVEHIHLTKTGNDFVDITVAKASDVEMPDFSRDPVDLSAGSKLIVALQDGTNTTDAKDYVWLTEVGIYEQVTLGTAEAAGTNYAAASSNQEKKDAAQQIANNITFSEGGQDYKVTATKVGNEWTYEVKTEEGQATTYTATVDAGVVTVEDNSHNPVDTTTENGLNAEEKQATKTEVVNEAIESVEYAGVAVTKAGEDTKLMTLEAFRDAVNGGNTYAGYTVKLLADIDLDNDNATWTPIGTSEHPFSGIFDGQGYAIKNFVINSASGYAGLFGNVTGTAADAPHASNGVWDSTSSSVILNSYSEDKYTASVKNLVIDGFEITNTDGNYVGAVVAYGKDAYFANITVKNGSVSGNGKTGGVIGATGENVVLDYLSTESSVAVSSSGHSVGGIIGGVNRGGSTPHLAVIVNCTNRANVSGTDTSNGIAAGILGHGADTSGLNVVIINCTNYGEIKCPTRTAGIVAKAQKVKLILNCVNYGKVWNEATSGNNILGGIAGECNTSGLQIVACINNGQVTGFAGNGKIAGIIGSIQNANLIEGCVNRGTITNTKANGTYDDITAGAANVLVADNATYTVDSSVSGAMTSISIIGGETTCTSIVIDNDAIEKVFVAIDNFNGTITGLAGKTLYISGANSTVTIPQDSSIDKVVVSGANCTIINNGTVGAIRFEVAGNHSIENNETISNSANNAFTISSTVNGANVSIANNGTIAASGSEGAYALYFGSGAACTVNNHGTITGNNFGKVTVSE